MVPAREGLFVSRLARLPVSAPTGELIGRISDVVVARPAAGAQPVPVPVLGLVVSAQRRPIFISMNRVRELDAGGATLRSGAVNLRRFAVRPGETLVLGELLDARVTSRETGAALRVNDVAIGRGRDGWTVTALDVIEPQGRLTPLRRARHRRLAWSSVTGLEPSGSAESRLAATASLRPADLAAALQTLPVKAQRELVAGLDDDRLADMLEELPEELQARLLATVSEERAADVLEAMDPDDAADLLGTLSYAEQARLLALMARDEAEPVRRLLRYDDETAGGLMTTEPVILGPQATVAEGLARAADPELPPPLAGQVFVVRPPTETPTGVYLGVAHLQRMLREPPGTSIGDVLDTDLDPLDPNLPTRRVAEYLATYDLLAAPVCDAHGRLLGAVSVDDVLDHLLPKTWRREAVRSPAGGPTPPDAATGPPQSPHPPQSSQSTQSPQSSPGPTATSTTSTTEAAGTTQSVAGSKQTTGATQTAPTAQAARTTRTAGAAQAPDGTQTAGAAQAAGAARVTRAGRSARVAGAARRARADT